MTLTVHAPAKLNLTLDILGLLPGGYHALDSVMIAVDLCDTLTLRPSGAGIRLTCSDSSLPQGADNLICKAANAFFAHIGLSPGGLEIALTKRIPAQAGFGGGSADAAATLVGLNRLYNRGLTSDELCKIGLSVGSDIPFCLMGGAARVGGRGERLTPLSTSLGEAVFLIAKPAQGVSTRLAFEAYDRQEHKPAAHTGQMAAALTSGNLSAIGRAMSNGFEQALFLPQVQEVKAAILEGGSSLGAAMTGSGSAVAGLFPDQPSAARCLAKLGERFPFARLVRLVAHGPKISSDV